MTNQEAIALLKIERDHMTPTILTERVEAMDMAISALHAQDSPKPTAESVQNVQNGDLILRKAAIDALGERPTVWTDDDQYALGERNQYDIDRLAIETLPSAQPEIVRCKDCKFWTHIKRTNRYWCKTDDGLYDLNPSPDDFCSRGERRTDDADANT